MGLNTQTVIIAVWTDVMNTLQGGEELFTNSLSEHLNLSLKERQLPYKWSLKCDKPTVCVQT